MLNHALNFDQASPDVMADVRKGICQSCSHVPDKSLSTCGNLSLHFNGHFPGEPGLDGFIGAKDAANGGDNWSYKMCKAPVKLSPPQTNTQLF